MNDEQPLKSMLRDSGFIILIAIVIVAALSGYAASVLTKRVSYPNNGSFQTLNMTLWNNSQLSIALTGINWNQLPSTPANYTRPIYVHNAGNVPFTIAVSNNNYSPAGLDSMINVSWNYTGSTIIPNATLEVSVTLQVLTASSYPATWSFTTNIDATQVV